LLKLENIPYFLIPSGVPVSKTCAYNLPTRKRDTVKPHTTPQERNKQAWRLVKTCFVILLVVQ